MAKRTRIIEGTWNCTSCDTKNIPARHRNCPQCNNPREETGQESEFDFGAFDPTTGKSLREGVTDEKALSAAHAGVDWFCEYCGASNRGDTTVCRNCKAQRSSASRALSAEPEPPIPESTRDVPPPPAAKRSGGKKWPYVLGVFVLGGMLCFWGSRQHASTGEVAGTEWTHTVHREVFQRTTRSDWRDQLRPQPSRMPVNGQGEVAGMENIRDCFPRQRSTRRVPDGTERVCESKSRRVQCGTEEKCTRQKMGNGYMKETCQDVPKYCSESYEDCHNQTRYRSEPVFDLSCSYDTYVWNEVGSPAVKSGRDSEPSWPELSAGPLERLTREARYTVHIRYGNGKKEYVLEPKSLPEFLSWKKGQPVSLQVNNFGSVSNVVHAGEER